MSGRHRKKSNSRKAIKMAVGSAIATTGLVATAPSASADIWDEVAECESSGRWNLNIGQYDGGLQFLPATWRGFGGEEFAPNAHQASIAEQKAVARRVLAVQGPGAWPTCSKKAGLTRSNGGAVETVSEPRHSAPEAPEPVDSGNEPRHALHEVVAGDTLGEIARDNQTTVAELMAKNPQIVDADLIYVGDRIEL